MFSVVLCSLGAPRSLHLGTQHIHSPPRSRVHSILTNGSSIPAGGAVWPTAIYWSTVEVGTPPVSFPVAIDSGSGDLDIAGKGCDGCVTTPPNQAYDPSTSSTSSAAFPFIFSNTYQTCDLKAPTAPCTISGRLHKDQVSLAGLGPVQVTFGAITRQTSNFDQFKQIDGVMGFTMGGSQNVFSRLVAAGKADNVWAICMRAGSQSNGTLTIGGVDARLSDGAVGFVPDAGVGFHSVQVSSLTLAGQAPIAVGKAAILDTGTNVLLLPKALMGALQAQMCADASLAHCADLWAQTCVPLTAEQVAAYPPLSMQLDGLELKMTPKDYLLLGSPLAASADQYCLGIRDGGSAGGSGFIIGDTTMRNYYLVFDLARRKIGWGNVSAACGSVGEGAVAAPAEGHADAPSCPRGQPANCAKIDFCDDCGNCPLAPCYCAECAPGYTKHSTGCGTVADECVKVSSEVEAP